MLMFWQICRRTSYGIVERPSLLPFSISCLFSWVGLNAMTWLVQNGVAGCTQASGRPSSAVFVLAKTGGLSSICRTKGTIAKRSEVSILLFVTRFDSKIETTNVKCD